MSDGSIWRWLAFGAWLVELGIGAGVCLPAVLDVYYVTPAVALILRSILFGINLVPWLILVFCADPSGTSVNRRGDSVLRHHSIYFLLAASAHLLLLVGWIVHLVKFAGLSPLDFTNNLPAFFVRRDLDFFGVLVLLAVTLFSIYDRRHAELRLDVAQLRYSEK